MPETNDLIGNVRVTFDAGGRESGVSINPQRPVITGETEFRVTWTLLPPLHTSGDYVVGFGNVIPCQANPIQDYLLTHELEPKDGRPVQTWHWIFRPLNDKAKPPTKLTGEIAYEIFFSYQPKITPLLPPSQQRIRLGKVMKVDPTIALPPKSSGGPGTETE